MAILRLPEQVIEGIAKIPTLTDESYQEILSALESIPLRINQDDIFDRELPSKILSIPKSDATAILVAIFSLYMGRTVAEVSLPTFVNDIGETLKRSESESTQWASSDKTLNKFKQRMTQLLNVSGPKVITKAYDILTEHEHIFSKSRILTDIRSVFGEDRSDVPAAAIIVHMLKLEYTHNDEAKEFFMAMDTKDIQGLIDTLERAKSKVENLKSVLAAANINYVEVV